MRKIKRERKLSELGPVLFKKQVRGCRKLVRMGGVRRTHLGQVPV